jgi:CheY-like chemotaxis protein
MDYEVAAFGSGEDYLASDFVARTSCLISDWKMPGMSGIELQDRLIAEGHRIPVIFVTAACAEGEQNRETGSGETSGDGMNFPRNCRPNYTR